MNYKEFGFENQNFSDLSLTTVDGRVFKYKQKLFKVKVNQRLSRKFITQNEVTQI
jgi:hypothetical protein